MDTNDTGSGQDNKSSDFEKLINNFWGSMLDPLSGLFEPFDGTDLWESKGRVSDSIHANLSMFQLMMKNMGDPAILENFQKISAMMPDVSMGIAANYLQSMNTLQSQAGEWIKKRGASLSSSDFQELDRELIKSLSEVYEKEFRKFFKIPQLGLGRLYQERVLEAVDKLNTLQLLLSEFYHMLYMPVEKSILSLQQEISEMEADGTLDDNSKTYYNLWIKLLEGHYMELFKRPEYAELMGKVVGAVNEFVTAKQAVINDLLKQTNIPTIQDMDELSREIYLLKKRIRTLEKRENGE